jgi:membrane fusion protein, multidrug efflux system
MSHMSRTSAPAPAAVSPGGAVVDRTPANNAPVPSAPASAPPKAPAPAAPPARRVPHWVLGLGAGLIAVAAYVYVPSLFVVETDDAYVQADTVTIMPKVAAYVTALHVTDNSAFTAGELLIQLDPREFQATVAMAKASLQSAKAGLANAIGQLDEQNEVVAADAAKVQGDRARVAFAQEQLTRFGTLAKDGAATTENWQQAQSDIAVREAAQQSDTATLNAARAQIEVLQSEISQARANVAHAQAVLAKALLNLSYTKIYAPVSGTVANRTVQVGNYVEPGQALFSAVPNHVYIIANFKETQLTNMRVGQPVDIRVDAFPNLKLRGYVNSFQRGTGSYFALLPPENATGNFVKVVQRVPVKILLDGRDPDAHMIAPGMSVEATVITHAPPAWLAPFVD